MLCTNSTPSICIVFLCDVGMIRLFSCIMLCTNSTPSICIVFLCDVGMIRLFSCIMLCTNSTPRICIVFLCDVGMIRLFSCIILCINSTQSDDGVGEITYHGETMFTMKRVLMQLPTSYLCVFACLLFIWKKCDFA